MASQTRLSASIATAESALQIVDAGTIGYFEEQGLMACYNELPTLTEHDSDELIKIPLHELKPFRDIDELPDGLFMTLRPKELMQLGNSKKKLANYENQVAALLAMMEE